MMKIGRRQRVLANALGSVQRPYMARPSKDTSTSNVLSAMKSRMGMVSDGDGQSVAAHFHQKIDTNPNQVSGSSNVVSAEMNGSTGFGGNNAKVDRFNPIFDDLSRGTVAEDWIPRDPRLQNRMFRMMFARDEIAGPVVETISELVWSDFDITGIRDPAIRGTYEAAKDAVKVDRYLPEITKEYLVIGRSVIQLVLDPTAGIWTDLVIQDSDYLKVGMIPRTGFMPKIDVLPSPELQAFARSQDPRDLDAKRGLPKSMLDQFAQNQPVPLDPKTTAYLPRRSFFNDVFGTSFYVRNIPFWGLQKAMINATLTGYRRRAGPITQIAVGSEDWEPTPEQIDALVSAYTAAEEDSVSSTIGTRYDVAFNQIRGGLNEMWKWSDEFAFLKEAKLAMFGVSELLITGEYNIDTTTAPTVFLERLKAHRRYIVEGFLMQKFFRSLAVVHDFRQRTPAELAHRIRIDNDERDLILPTLNFHRNLDAAADSARVDLLDKMEEKGLYVPRGEWNRALGGGDLMARMKNAAEDLEMKLQSMKLTKLQQQVEALTKSAGTEEKLKEKVEDLIKEVRSVKFAQDRTPDDIAMMDDDSKERAADLADGYDEPATTQSENTKAPTQHFSSGSVYVPTDTKVRGTFDQDAQIDRTTANRDSATLSSVGKVG